MKEIIFVGRSNVGKSSLIRALTGKNVRVGKRPGVTRKFLHIHYKNVIITDMPGLGFMSGVPKRVQETIKDDIVHYIEENAENIILAIMVVNATSFAEIVDRWLERNQIPVELELYEFLRELNIKVIVAVNKIDKVRGAKNVDKVLDGVAERLGMLPPWRQWIDTIVPVSAKKGEVEGLKKLIQKQVEQAHNHL